MDIRSNQRVAKVHMSQLSGPLGLCTNVRESDCEISKANTWKSTQKPRLMINKAASVLGDVREGEQLPRL